MKKQILFFAATALCISNTLMLTASPAQAQRNERPSQRFNFAYNEYAEEEPTGRRRTPTAQRQVQTTSVTHGAVPNASTMIGFNPKFLDQMHNSSTVSSNITQAPTAVPQRQPMPAYSQQFGQPARQGSLTPPAQTASTSVPNQTAFATNHTSGKLLSPPQRIKRTSSAAPRANKPQRSKPAAQRVAHYGEDLYSAGPTKPTSSVMNSTREVNGKVLWKNTR